MGEKRYIFAAAGKAKNVFAELERRADPRLLPALEYDPEDTVIHSNN